MKFKLLIADDSTLVRKNLKRLLINIDLLDILESRDTVSTIKVINQENPHILLLDLSMPNGSGYDVLKYIKEKKQKILIMILTNNPSEENRKKCMTEGADFFFDKSKQHRNAVKEIKDAVISFSRIEEGL